MNSDLKTLERRVSFLERKLYNEGIFDNIKNALGKLSPSNITSDIKNYLYKNLQGNHKTIVSKFKDVKGVYTSELWVAYPKNDFMYLAGYYQMSVTPDNKSDSNFTITFNYLPVENKIFNGTDDAGKNKYGNYIELEHGLNSKKSVTTKLTVKDGKIDESSLQDMTNTLQELPVPPVSFSETSLLKSKHFADSNKVKYFILKYTVPRKGLPEKRESIDRLT